MVIQDIEKTVSHWIEGSNEDLDAAAKLREGKLWAHSLFFVHLALEKKIKALIVQESKEHAPFSHNLVYLIGKTKAVVSEEMLKKLTVITDFNLSGRYREEKEKMKYQINEFFVLQWTKHAEEIHRWLNQYLKPS